MIYLLALAIVTNVAVVTVAFRAALTIVERRERSAERDRDRLLATIDELCQRIQAPDLAIIDHQAKQGAVINPPAVGWDNDDEYWQTANMTKDELAEQMMNAELAETS